MSANGTTAGFTKYGFRLVSESRVNSYWVCALPDVVPSTTPTVPGMSTLSSSSAVTPTASALDRSIDAVPFEPSRSSTSNSVARYASASGHSSDSAVGLVGVNGTSPTPHTDIAAHAVTTPSTG